jgi:hypothetical protein
MPSKGSVSNRFTWREQLNRKEHKGREGFQQAVVFLCVLCAFAVPIAELRFYG